MRRLTTEEFITKAVNVHGNLYDYSTVRYKTATKKINITCPRHGIFEQQPNNHLTGHGCPACGGRHIPTTEEFIKSANIIHDNKYDYSETEYNGAFSKVIITCPIHGNFLQMPTNHITGKKGCKHCKASRSETALYKSISNAFPTIKIIRNSRPDFLNGLEYDIYIPSIGIAIEYDGQQHFHPVRWTSQITEEQADNAFKRQQVRDAAKNSLSVAHNILLIRVSYIDFNENRCKTLDRVLSTIKSMLGPSPSTML